MSVRPKALGLVGVRGVGSCALLATHKLHLHRIAPRPLQGWASDIAPSTISVSMNHLNMGGAPYRHLGKLGCVRSDPYEPTSTGIGVGRGGAATHL